MFITVQWIWRVFERDTTSDVCGKFSGSPESTGTSGGADSLAEGCGRVERHISDSCTDIFHHQLAEVAMVEPCQVQDVVLHQVVVAKACFRCLDRVCFVGPNQ